MSVVKLINLETGEYRKVDLYKLSELGFPEGFEVAEELSIEQWVEAIQKALEK